MIDLSKYLKPKKEEEEEKKEKLGSQFGGGWGIADLVKETQKQEIDLSKYIIPKGEIKTGVGVKAEETKKEEPNVFDTLNEDIEKNYKKYQSLTKKLEAYQAEYDYAPNNIKPSLAANYNKLVKESNDLAKQLQIDIKERDRMITTINKVNFTKYKQLTGLPEETGYPTPSTVDTAKPKSILEWGKDPKMMELHKINFESFKLWFEELKESKDKVAFFKGEGQSPELKELRKQYEKKAPYMYGKSEQWIENISMIAVGVGMAWQLVNAAVTSGFKIKDKVISAKELKGVLERARAAYVPETGKFKATLSDNDFTIMKQLNVFFKTSGRGTAAREMLEKIIEQTGGLSFPQQVNIFGGRLYAGVPIDEMVKSIVAVGRLTQDIANQLKVMNPIDTGLVFQQLSMVSPAIASKVASQFVELIPQKIEKIPKVGEEMKPEELEQFEKLKEAKIIPKEEIEPTKEELERIEGRKITKEEFVEKMRERIVKPVEEPEKIEPEPTPEEIRSVFMDKENLETTAKNREYFLGKFGKLFTETKKVEDTLIKEKFNEMQSMIEYEEDEIYRLALGKEKMRIPVTTKTEWMEGLGKGKYMQIFRDDKNLQYPDEVASNLGISEDALREQIIERIRTAPKKVTLEGAKQALIDERDSIFMQVTAQMDAYRILLDEIEGGEYSFDTPQNIKRLNAKISTLKRDSKELMGKYEKEITELQKKGIEEKYEELRKRSEAIEKIEIERGIKKGLKIAKAELKGKKFKDMTKEEIKEGNKLIQRIQMMVKGRGLTKKQFSDIKMTHGGARSLSSKTRRMTIPQLKAVSKAIEAARPKRIGWKKVVTPKTENKIQSLKDNLIDKLQMTEETYKNVLKDVGVYKEPKYIDAKHFITEEQGKDIIYRLIDEAAILRTTLPYKQAVEKNPEIKKVIDKELSLIKPGDKKLKDPWEMNSMRVYFQKMGEITGESFYRLGQDLINTHSENKKELHEFIEGFSEFKDVVRSEEAIKKVDDYIVCKSTLEKKPEYPKEITKQEIEMAKKVEGVLKDYETKARTLAFINNIDHLEGMPQYAQYRKEMNKARDIYESKGFDDLVEYMETQEFGIIKSGYSPLQVISPKVRVYEPRPTAFGKGHIKHRTDIEYKEQDRNILQRLFSYKKQMDNLVSMYPKVKALITLTDKNLDKFENPNRVKNAIELFLKELKGYNRPEGLVERTLNRAYSQSIQVIIMPSPVLSGRNLLQNPAFAFDKTILIDPRNKNLTADEVEYLNTYVSQMEVMKADWFLIGEKPYFGKIGEALIGLINKIGLYPRSDQGNRIWAFWAKINQVKRAFDKDVSLSKQMEEAKFSDIESSERIMALEILAKDGKEAMAKYIAKVYTDDTNFRYARYERSPAEMGKHKWFTNLMLFPRSYWELLLKHGNKLKTGTIKEQGRAFKVLTNIIVGGLIVGAAYKKATGRRENPYNPLVLLAYEPGGLAIGVVEAATDVYANTIMALSGDERAMAALTTAIPKLADMFIPFFAYTIRGYEAMTDKKNVDREALRKIRELLDKEYEVRGSAYELERNAIEKWQYFLSGAGIDVAIKEREKAEKEKGKFPTKIKFPEKSKFVKPKFPTRP